MPTPTPNRALIAKPLKPLRLELAQGCADRVVMGGVEGFLKLWAEEMTRLAPAKEAVRAAALAERFRDYATMPTEDRRHLLMRVLEELETTPTRAPRAAHWEDPLTVLEGVGEHRAQLLRQMGIETVGDLLSYYPHDYEDRSAIAPLSAAEHRKSLLARVTVTGHGVSEYKTRPKKAVVPARDATRSCELVWYNQPWMARHYAPGDRLLVRAEARCLPGGLLLMVSHSERLEPESESEGGLVPRYGTVEGISEAMLRGLLRQALAHCAEIPAGIIPPPLAAARELLPLAEAVSLAHQPPDMAGARTGQARLSYEMLFGLQAHLGRYRQRRRQGESRSQIPSEGIAAEWAGVLPFALTGAQERAISEALGDLAAEFPGHRLLHGDVGAGKTAVAGAVLLAAARAGRQAALMAPTELLAEQHYAVLSAWLKPLSVSVYLLTGSAATGQAMAVREALASGKAQVTVGTHALFQRGVSFDDLAVVVVDEQHRFGVRQRAELAGKGPAPNLLVMSATPIPRTLALTAYGDFDVTVLDELPPGRQPVFTQVLPQRERRQAYESLIRQAVAGRRAFVVCPIIEEGERAYVASAEETFARLQAWVPSLRWGLVHGRQKKEDRARTMDEFRRGDLDVLVATSVVEVGVDVPEASLMLVENAERFGLAQLHQLRGRVARAKDPASCYLLTVSKVLDTIERLQVLERTNDGFEIAQEDLKRRGPGEILGERQSGYVDVRVAQAASDTRLLVQARDDAFALLEEDPALTAEGHQALAAYLARLEARPGGWTL